MNTLKLIPCPFCGNDGSGSVEDALHVSMAEHEWRGASWTVQCDKCTATMGYSDSEDEAVEAWNRRSPAKEPDIRLVTETLLDDLEERIGVVLIDAEVEYPAGRGAGHQIWFDSAKMRATLTSALTTAFTAPPARGQVEVNEQAVMVCPQCEGEGRHADGLDDSACSTDCTRCGTNGWIVDRSALTSPAEPAPATGGE